MVRVIQQREFVWRGFSLHLGQRSKPVLELIPDVTFPYLFRIRYPDGWTSSSGNLTRAKDAAYGHARYLLGQESLAGAVWSRKTGRDAA